ncbi:PAS domain-containing protein [Methylobacterium sp. PvR107]|uniref:PAS domain-containing protein n=1 Tax=Methylobacterium sp. PvR107 TaxID=2806597 RepID=UPI001AE7C230|nr:PAS domain S-box-containing protein [Methylobacterium sp. PvR107]
METGGTATSHVPDELKAEAHRGDPFAAAVRATRMPMIVTDPSQHDNPIVFANNAFLKLTGYTRFEVLGRNCRFLQGPETESAAIDRIRDAVRQQVDVRVDLLNYRKDGTTFHNALYVGPVRDADGKVVYFFASQLDVSEQYALTAEIERLEGELAEARTKLAAR